MTSLAGYSRLDPCEVADRIRSACLRGVETSPVVSYGLLRGREVTLFQLAQTWGFEDVDVQSRSFRTEWAEQAISALPSRQRVILGWLGNVWLRDPWWPWDPRS